MQLEAAKQEQQSSLVLDDVQIACMEAQLEWEAQGAAWLTTAASEICSTCCGHCCWVQSASRRDSTVTGEQMLQYKIMENLCCLCKLLITTCEVGQSATAFLHAHAGLKLPQR